MTIDIYPLLTPTLIVLNPVDNSEKAIFMTFSLKMKMTKTMTSQS